MTRRFLTFPCAGAALAASLDKAAGTTGLLLVSGGNEVRSGPWGSQAQLAAQLAARGFHVLRFDRRGVGDSEGVNRGFRHSSTDIIAAIAAFREAAPGLERIVGYGNCDAASALMLSGGAGLDGLIVSNPWTIEDDAAPPPPAAVRAHYLQRLKDPRALVRVLSGRVSLRGLAASLRRAAAPAAERSPLAQDMAAGIARFAGPVTILLAGRDRTAQVFRANWDASDPRIATCAEASHSFVEPEARRWLLGRIEAALRG